MSSENNYKDYTDYILNLLNEERPIKELKNPYKSQNRYYWENRQYILNLKKEKMKDPEYAEKVRKYNKNYYDNRLSKIYYTCEACNLKLLRHGYRHHKKTKKHYDNMVRVMRENNVSEKEIESYPKPKLRPNELQRRYNKAYYKRHAQEIKERAREHMREVRKNTVHKIDREKPFLSVIKLY